MKERPQGNHATRHKAYRFGLFAETVSAFLLRCKGYRIIARRYRTARGEIDLIAKRGRLLVFVEVKARTKLAQAEEAVTPVAQRRITAAADIFVARHQALADCDRRFDIALIAPYRFPRFVINAFDADR